MISVPIELLITFYAGCGATALVVACWLGKWAGKKHAAKKWEKV